MGKRKITLETIGGEQYFAVDDLQTPSCRTCAFVRIECPGASCDSRYRKDRRDVIFKSTDDIRLWVEYHQQEDS